MLATEPPLPPAARIQRLPLIELSVEWSYRKPANKAVVKALVRTLRLVLYLQQTDNCRSASSGDISRMVKKLMRPRTHSISGVRRAVLDSELGLYAFRLLLTQERAGRSPFPGDFSRDDRAPHTLGAHARATLPQTGSAATGTSP